MKSCIDCVCMDEKGMSLVEVMVYAVFLVLILSGAYIIYQTSDSLYVTANGQAAAQGRGRITQASLTKHLRMAEGFAVAGDYAVTIRADINDDNLWETVEYYLDGDRLFRRTEGEGEKALVSGVRNSELGTPIFTYYDHNGNDLTSDPSSRITKTHKVRITLTIDIDPQRPPDAYTLVTRVTLRNTN